MFEWLSTVWDLITYVFELVIEILVGLCNKIDSIQFEDEMIISNSLGLIKYVVGEGLYTTLFLGFNIMAGLLIWKFVKIILNAIFSVIPYIKARFE